MTGAISAVSTALVGSAAIGGAAATTGLIGAGGVLTAGGIATTAGLAGTAITALGAVNQGQSQAAAAKYNAQVASNNAQVATQNSQFAGAEGEQNVNAQGMKNRAQMGALVANEGASGVDVDSGSSLQTRESQAQTGMLNELNIRSQAVRQAYGFQTQAVSDLGQESLDKAQSKNDSTAGYVNAGGDVLGGIGNAAKFTSFLSKDPLGGLTSGYTDSPTSTQV